MKLVGNNLDEAIMKLSRSTESERLGRMCYVVDRRGLTWIQFLYPEFYEECHINVSSTIGVWQMVKRYV